MEKYSFSPNQILPRLPESETDIGRWALAKSGGLQ